MGLNRWKVLENDEHVFLDSIYLGLFGVRWFKSGTRLSTGRRFRDGQVKFITEKWENHENLLRFPLPKGFTEIHQVVDSPVLGHFWILKNLHPGCPGSQ